MLNLIKAFYFDNVILFTSIHFLLILFLIFYNRKKIQKVFEDLKFDKYLLIGLATVILLSTLIFSVLNIEFYSVQDWLSLNIAKEFLSGNTKLFQLSTHGPEYPFLLSVFFLFFGASTEVANIFTIFFSIIGIIAIFLSTFLLFEDRRVSFLSSLVFLLTHHVLYYTSILKGRTIVISSFVALTMFFFILAYKLDKPSGYLLAILSLIACFNLKFEYMNYIYLFIVGLFLFRRNVFNRKKLLDKFYLVFLISPIFLLNTISKIQAFSGKHQGALAALSGGKGNFSLSYFSKNLSLFANYWWNELSLILLLLFGLGIGYFIFKKKKEIAFLLLGFVIPSLVYLFYYSGYSPRYAVTSFPFLCPLIGLGIKTIDKFFQSLSKKIRKVEANLSILKISIFIFIVLLIGYSQFNLVTGLKQSPQKRVNYKIDQSHEIAEKLERVVEEENPYIVVPHAQTKWMIKFITGFEVEHLGVRGILSQREIKLYYQDKLNKTYRGYKMDLPVEQRDVYLITNRRCYNKKAHFSHFWYFCNSILSNYNKNLKFDGNFYRIYKLS